MKRTTQAEIDEMRARGYEEDTIKAAEFSVERTERADRLIEQIREAFAGTQLGSGVGLWQCRALDDYATETERAAAALLDEKKDWQRISVKDLTESGASLCFTDPQGMRFLLPVYMIADLGDEYINESSIFVLTYPDHFKDRQFGLLSGEQRKVVRDFLFFMLEEDYFPKKIQQALDEYWTENTCVNAPVVPSPKKSKLEPWGVKQPKGKAYKRQQEKKVEPLGD